MNLKPPDQPFTSEQSERAMCEVQSSEGDCMTSEPLESIATLWHTFKPDGTPSALSCRSVSRGLHPPASCNGGQGRAPSGLFCTQDCHTGHSLGL